MVSDETTTGSNIGNIDYLSDQKAGSKGQGAKVDQNVASNETSTVAATASTTHKMPNTTTTTTESKATDPLLLQNLGRNARERLQQERSKRRVIQRIHIDHNLVPPQQRQQQQKEEGQRRDATGNISTATALAPTTTTNTTIRRVSTRKQQKSNLILGKNNALVAEATVRGKKRAATTTAKMEATAVVTRRTKQQRKRHLSNQRQTAGNDLDTDMMIDRWVPDISHISDDNTIRNTRIDNIVMEMKDSRMTSTFVQLHGLPVNTTVQQIRTFFTGLEIQHILLLLPYLSSQSSNGEKFCLIDYDAKHTDRDVGEIFTGKRMTKAQPRGKNKINTDVRIERYDTNTVRLLVQFPSYTIAALAQKRSGEVIYVHPSENNQTAASKPAQQQQQQQQQRKDEDDDTQQMGATIAITILPPAVATIMTNRLAIDINDNHIVNRTALTIEQILEPILQRIDPKISMELWETVIEELSLNVNRTIPSKKMKFRSSYLQMMASNVDIEELQNERIQLQQEIDRILHISSSSSVRCSTHDNRSNNKNDKKGGVDFNHENKILLFLLSTTTTTGNTTNDMVVSTHPNHPNKHNYDRNPTKFACMLNTISLHSPDVCRTDHILYLTKEYIQLLQMYIHRIDTTIAIYHRRKILFGSNM